MSVVETQLTFDQFISIIASRNGLKITWKNIEFKKKKKIPEIEGKSCFYFGCKSRATVHRSVGPLPPSPLPPTFLFFSRTQGGGSVWVSSRGGCTGFIEPAAVRGGCTGVFQTHFGGFFDPKGKQKGVLRLTQRKFSFLLTTKILQPDFFLSLSLQWKQPASRRTCFSGVWLSFFFVCVFLPPHPPPAGDWVAVGWGRILLEKEEGLLLSEPFEWIGDVGEHGRGLFSFTCAHNETFLYQKPFFFFFWIYFFF